MEDSDRTRNVIIRPRVRHTCTYKNNSSSPLCPRGGYVSGSSHLLCHKPGCHIYNYDIHCQILQLQQENYKEYRMVSCHLNTINISRVMAVDVTCTCVTKSVLTNGLLKF